VTFKRSLVAFAALVLVIAASGGAPQTAHASAPTTWLWPGCAVQQGRPTANDQLQDCVNGAAAGDSVEITTNAVTTQFVLIQKSLTLFGAPFFHPTVTGIAVGTPTTAPITVAIRHLTIPAGLQARFVLGTGHLTVDDTSISMGSTSSDAVDLEAAVPSSFTVTRSHIQISGSETDGIFLSAHQPGPGLVTLAAIGDQISGHGDTQSSSGIELSLTGTGTTRADLMNDSIFDIASCNCGASAGILVDPQDTTVADINVVGMSIERSRSESVFVVNELKAGGRMTLDLFNNIFSHASDGALGIDSSQGVASRVTLSAGNNDYYGNGFPNQLEGRSPGAGNLSVLPHYVNGLKGDLRLTSTSPLIDKGIVCSPGGVANPDAAGMSRLAGMSVDLGAYEYGAGPITGVIRLGTSGNDVLTGSSGNDILCGYGGNDRIAGMAGNDFIDGGDGNDLIDGGAGNDILIGGPGNDKLIGESGSDYLYGGPGNDTLCARDGVRGNDHLDGGPGDDGYQADPGDFRTGVEFTTIC